MDGLEIHRSIIIYNYMNMLVPYILERKRIKAAAVNKLLCVRKTRLDDEEHGGRRVEGSVVDGDDGGAMSREQVAHLPRTQKHNT